MKNNSIVKIDGEPYRLIEAKYGECCKNCDLINEHEKCSKVDCVVGTKAYGYYKKLNVNEQVESLKIKKVIDKRSKDAKLMCDILLG